MDDKIKKISTNNAEKLDFSNNKGGDSMRRKNKNTNIYEMSKKGYIILKNTIFKVIRLIASIIDVTRKLLEFFNFIKDFLHF